MFLTLAACLRGAQILPRRMYLTANPGGIGHAWFKRLFIDREYDLEKGERPEDYSFIQATVDDNPALLEASPDYKRMLELQPPDVMRAWRYGDWDALGGTFFPEFGKAHQEAPMQKIPRGWICVRAFDYGLDMFACIWAAIDYKGRIHVYREIQQSNLIVSDAAKLALSLTGKDEAVSMTIAPPDMWNRQKDSGRSMAEIFMAEGLGIVKASNNRVQGWMAVKEALKPMEDGAPGLLVSTDCKGLIRSFPTIMHDDRNPSDCATEPHEITHILDACRYLAVTRMLTPSLLPQGTDAEDDEDGAAEDYDDAMTGGQVTGGYLSYGGNG